MKLITTSQIFCIICLAGILLTSCTKEDVLIPSGKDKNIYENKDNPNDPIDHAMYRFYKETGLANFYSDTIDVQKISLEGEVPERFRYTKIGLNYTPAGFSRFTTVPLSNKQVVPDILDLMKNKVLPSLPKNHYISCLLFLNDFLLPIKFLKSEISHGMSAIVGFNTVGIVAKNTALMNEAEKEMYAASILAGLTVDKIIVSDREYLNDNFFNISRGLSKNVLTIDIYDAAPIYSSIEDANNFALLYYPIANNFFYESPNLPNEDSDLRSFLTMAFKYNVEAFTALYGSNPSIIQKFIVLRDLLQRRGYGIAE